MESQQTFAETIQANNQKHWGILADLGKHAFEKLKNIVEHTTVDRLKLGSILHTSFKFMFSTQQN